MKNFLIIVLSLGLAAAAFMTRPDRGEFERYVRERAGSPDAGNAVDGILKEVAVQGVLDNVEFKDFYLWTVVSKDGKTLYTGVFDRWIDNEKLRESIPS
jgi:hypothetical protein